MKRAWIRVVAIKMDRSGWILDIVESRTHKNLMKLM